LTHAVTRHLTRTDTVLAFCRVERGYVRGKPVLRELSFSMQRNEIVALLGKNGSGKTTLVHLAMGLLQPQRGSVHTFGLVPTEHAVKVKQRIGYVGEQQQFPPQLTVTDMLTLHRRLFPTWDVTLERELLDRFGLGAARGKLSTLSKGQRQQAALLCAICHRPELLLLDEPAAGLDPSTRREFLETSIQLLNREGTAILFSSHHMGDVERLGGRVLLLTEGTIRLDRPLDVLREAHCLVVVPRHVSPDGERLRAQVGVLHLRLVGQEWHAIVDGEPLATELRFRAALGTMDLQASALPLEELFIEMVASPAPVAPTDARSAPDVGTVA